jgi:putative ABC transport system permease protein
MLWPVLESQTARHLRLGDSFVGAHGVSGNGDVHMRFPYTVTGILAPNGSVIDRLVLTSVESV